MTFDLFGDDVLRRANALSFGREQLPTFDLANARFVLSFGADFLGTWNSPVAQNVGYGLMRQGRPGIRGAFAQVESRMSQTGASADEWVPVKPGTEGVLALGIAKAIVDGQLRPASGAGRAGALDRRVERRARQLRRRRRGADHRRLGRPHRAARAPVRRNAAVGGDRRRSGAGAFQRPVHGACRQRAERARRRGRSAGRGVVHAAARRRGGRQGRRRRRHAGPALGQFAADVIAGAASPQVLIVDGANPVFTTPPAWRVREAFEKIPYIVSFSSFLDETSGAGGSDPAGSLVPRVVERGDSRVGFVDGRGQRGAAGDASAAPDAGDAGRAARDRAHAAASARVAVADLRRDARRDLRRAPGSERRRRCVDRRAGEGHVVRHAAGGPRGIGRASGRGVGAGRVRRTPVRRRRRTSIRSTSCRIPRTSSSTGRWRTCRGCRKCPIR